jgi:hypothetical protein
VSITFAMVEWVARALPDITYNGSECHCRLRPLRCCRIKELRIHFLALFSKAAKKLRLSQAQAKKLVKKLRLAFSHIGVQFLKRLGLGRSPADFRISQLRFAKSLLRFYLHACHQG